MTEAYFLLQEQNKMLKEALVKLEHDFKVAIAERDLIIKNQQHRIDQLLRQLFGQKSERLPVQSNLFEELPFSPEELALVEPELSVKTIAEHKRKEKKKDPHSLRYELPEHLRREEVVIEPTSIPEGAIKIGEEVSEKLEITKAELFVKRTIRPKYVLADKSTVIVAALPQGPLYRCLAGVSLLVHILIDKYVDHLPLYRQIDRFARQGVKMKDSTIGDWVSQVAKLLEILYKELEKDVLSSNYLGTDETTIKVLDPAIKGKCHKGYLWAYLAHDKNLVLFDYDPSRGKHVVGQKLLDYQGYLQSDGYAGYEQFDTHQGIIRLGCMAHARRKFDEAKQEDQESALKVLTMMQRIYRLEYWMRHYKIAVSGKKILREKIAVPLLNEMFDWMQEQLNNHTPSSKMYLALNYSIKRRNELMQYCQDGQLHIDNNLVENKIRPTVIGKKNFLFMGSHDSAQRSAMLYSFLLSCKANNINPEEWLQDVLTRINDCKQSQLIDILPHRWTKQTCTDINKI
jgi:transposase